MGESLGDTYLGRSLYKEALDSGKVILSRSRLGVQRYPQIFHPRLNWSTG